MSGIMKRGLYQRRDRLRMGFTLLEILVVLALVGILGAIASPAWVGFSVNQSLNAAQSRAFSNLRSAQSSAKRDQVDWQASFRNFGDLVPVWTNPVPLLLNFQYPIV